MRYVIIGAGVAGFAAVEAIRSLDSNSEVVMVSDDPHGFYSRPGLAYYLTGELDDKALYPRARNDYRDLALSFVQGRVKRILRDKHTLEIEGKPPLTYSKLLLAVGSHALSLGAPGENFDGVVKLDHFEDAKRIIKVAKHSKRAVVVGGGITALELTEALLARGVETHYLLRGDRYWSNVLDGAESRIVEARLQAEGVQLHYHSDLQEILGKKGRVTGVLLKGGNTIACDMVAYAVGITPRIELAQAADINCERGILADEHLQTNDPDIYAAGDVAQVYDPLSGRSVIDSLWTPAREQGYAAGLNMAGRKSAYLKSAPFNVTRLAGLTTTIIGAVGRGRDEDIVGIARGDSETWRDLPEALVAQGGFDVNRVRLLIGDQYLLGAVLMGDQKLSLPLQKMISHKANISSIRDSLLQPNAPVADIIADFWMTWRESIAA